MLDINAAVFSTTPIKRFHTGDSWLDSNKSSTRKEAGVYMATKNLFVPSNSPPPLPWRGRLALLRGNTFHQCVVAVCAQKRMTATADRLSTFIAPAGLHCASAFADAEDVTVRAGKPMSTVG